MTTLTRDDLLVLLIEEAAEVIQAATKCLRFGWDRDYPGKGVNHQELAREVGEMEAILEALPLEAWARALGRNDKLARAEAKKRIFGDIAKQEQDDAADEAIERDERDHMGKP